MGYLFLIQFSMHVQIVLKYFSNLSPINEIVSNGDQIEVLISKGQKPQPNWLTFCITGKATGINPAWLISGK